MNPDKFNLNCNDLETIVKRYYGNAELNFQIQSTEVTCFSVSRVGYLGDHFILKIRVILEGNVNRADDINLFFKVLPKRIPAMTNFLEVIGTFQKEARLYVELFPQMEQFTRFAPKVYLAKDDQLLVLENVALNGYRSIDDAQMGIFDKAHLEQALKALARFHCASLMLETKTGRTLPELFPGALDENCWVLEENSPRIEEVKNNIQILCEFVKIIEKDNAELPNILKKLPMFIMQINDLVKPSDKYRNVACHSDLWSSNMLFKYSEASGDPVDCMIIDFQFVRYAPPAYDVHMLITLTTTEDFRKTHYDHLIEQYYAAVRQHLIAQYYLPEEIFPEQPFRESCRRYQVSGIIDNFLVNFVTLLPRSCVDRIFSSPEEYEKFSGEDKIRLCLGVFESDSNYRTRITGIIKDLIGFL